MEDTNQVRVLAPLPNQAWMRFSLGEYHGGVQNAVRKLSEENVIQRLWDHDHTLWNPDPREISNRLGWLHCHTHMPPYLPEISALRDDLIRAGIDTALLLGMGGSSLAPDLFSKTFPKNPSSLDLLVLDSTDPGAILDLHERLDPVKTIYIVSTKSGGTEETLSFLKYFYQQASQALGSEDVGNHFIAITDPGSKLVDLAQKFRFRKIFLNDPNLGGRYSALSHFGMVPATLTGIDSDRLLGSARDVASLCSPDKPVPQNPAAILGATLGTMASLGRDKLTFIIPPDLHSFADWAEQLIAESTGKHGKGILPVVGEELGDPEVYAQDRVFVHIYHGNGLEQLEPALNRGLSALEASGHPVIHIGLQDLYDIGGQFLLWELATALAGNILQINPFDQPNVEAAKVRAREMVSAYKSTGSLPAQTPVLETEQFALFSKNPARSLREAFHSFLEQANESDYISVQAYLQPLTSTTTALNRLQSTLREKTHLATTIGYGPRFLHSTGQLHKGDRGNGLFILLTSSHEHDIPIPDEISGSNSSMTFGVFILAQALGDQIALADAGRRLLRIHLYRDPIAAIEFIVQELGSI